MPTIPVELVPEVDDPLSIQVFTRGRIGNEHVRFLLDTGAATCLIPLNSATSQYPTRGPSTSSGAGNVVAHDEQIVVPELWVGDLRAEYVAADRGDLAAHRHPLLGMNVLGLHRCLFEFGRGAITVDVPKPPEWDVHQLDSDPTGIPFLKVAFDDVLVRACWDTAASRSGVDLAWAKRHPGLVTKGGSLTGYDSTGTELAAWEGTLASCSMGGVQFPASPCVVIDLGGINVRLQQPLEVIIGAPIIQRANWWFDFPGRQWAVQMDDSPHR